MDIANEDAKRALVDKETELGLVQDWTPPSKVELKAEIAQLQKFWAWLSAFRGDFVWRTVVRGRAFCPLSGVERLSATRRFQMHYIYGKINRGHGICPLYRGCPLLGESVIRGFTVVIMS